MCDFAGGGAASGVDGVPGRPESRTVLSGAAFGCADGGGAWCSGETASGCPMPFRAAQAEATISAAACAT
jgi:hypothetical protein